MAYVGRDLAEDIRYFAIDPPQIFFRVEIRDTYGLQVREPVIEPDDNDEPFAKKRQIVQMRLARLVGLATIAASSSPVRSRRSSASAVASMTSR